VQALRRLPHDNFLHGFKSACGAPRQTLAPGEPGVSRRVPDRGGEPHACPAGGLPTQALL